MINFSKFDVTVCVLDSYLHYFKIIVAKKVSLISSIGNVSKQAGIITFFDNIEFILYIYFQFICNVCNTLHINTLQVVTRLLEMPSDYWLQFTGSATLHSKTPPYNPNYFTRTPTTPECKPVPSSLLGALDENSQSVRTKKAYNAMTPK